MDVKLKNWNHLNQQVLFFNLMYNIHINFPALKLFFNK